MAKGNVMTPKAETPAQAAADLYTIQDLKQKQTVLNLDTNDDTEIVVITKKIVWKDGVSVADKMAALQSLVAPEEKQVTALAKFFESDSYQTSKEAALSAGNYLSSQLKSQITGIMGNLPAFADNSAKDNFERWLAGYKAKKASAITLLERAKAALAGSEFADL